MSKRLVTPSGRFYTAAKSPSPARPRWLERKRSGSPSYYSARQSTSSTQTRPNTQTSARPRSRCGSRVTSEGQKRLFWHKALARERERERDVRERERTNKRNVRERERDVRERERERDRSAGVCEGVAARAGAPSAPPGRELASLNRAGRAARGAHQNPGPPGACPGLSQGATGARTPQRERCASNGRAVVSGAVPLTNPGEPQGATVAQGKAKPLTQTSHTKTL